MTTAPTCIRIALSSSGRVTGWEMAGCAVLVAGVGVEESGTGVALVEG